MNFYERFESRDCSAENPRKTSTPLIFMPVFKAANQLLCKPQKAGLRCIFQPLNAVAFME
ncbi:MAG: hypothetical protein A3I66_19800 [Burkholderiales bacterium RIFCSPLOWO2_02_FULL_57_36]|nr:MAG: hypothetical protein A3I66_19800 [Burkholderiales bacterium RIFCSPLOWO2_02_FULL_57_36]